MLKTGKLVEALQAIGVATPPRPMPPFEVPPEHPIAEHIEADRIYQDACLKWIAAVKTLHMQHFPPT